VNCVAEGTTRHAAQRMIDRSIPEIAIRLLRECGTAHRAGRGTVSYSFDKRGWREVERILGPWPLKNMTQLKRVYIVENDDGLLITAAYRD
jgi:hypothetical protein